MRKKFIAIVATMAMVMTMVPSMVFADTALTPVSDANELVGALESGKGVVFSNDIKIDPAKLSNAYGTTGINVKNGQTIDGAGNTLDIKGAGGTWDSGINTTGGLIKNIKVTGSFRGIFINHNSTHCEKVVLDNVIIEGTTYTISCDQGSDNGLEARNSTFNGWTSFAATTGPVTFENCKFGKGNGYAYLRPYAPTKFIGCEFEEGYRINPRAEIMLVKCKLNGEPITKDNISKIITTGDEKKVTINNCMYTDESGQTQYREDHVFGNELKKDADNHWFECDCGEKEEVAPHKYVNGVCECGAKAPAEKPEKSPNTGDNSLPYTMAVAGMVLAAMAAVVATRRRTN